MKICIIGGGTTGWWAAGYLEKFLPDYSITLIESPTIRKIGVGESTLPQIANFFTEMGIKEEDWMDSANAVRKLGNIKRNWNNGVDVPFTFWSNEDKKFEANIDQYLQGDIDKLDLLESFNEDNVYAYHLDAEYASDVVKQNCKNVKHIESTIELLPSGYDLYLDCTGFSKKFVKDKTVITPDDLFVDSAWVCPFELPEDYPTQYTQSIARHSGWQFIIDLQHRIGTGYVFSSKHQRPEIAREYFYNYTHGWTPLRDEPRLIQWDPGYLKNPWTENVVAMGLAGGFIDPLESNALFMIQFSITNLARCLQRGIGPDGYNRMMRKVWNDNVQFIQHHYMLSEKTDSDFWKYYNKFNCTKSLWENYNKYNSRWTNLYPNSVWATLGLYYNEFKYYKGKQHGYESIRPA